MIMDHKFAEISPKASTIAISAQEKTLFVVGIRTIRFVVLQVQPRGLILNVEILLTVPASFLFEGPSNILMNVIDFRRI